MGIASAFLLLIVALVLILVAANLFTNAIEWFGSKLDLSHGVVGSLLAAVGTALPETAIPIIAFIAAATGGHPAAGHDVGIGAVIGAPFMLATLAMMVTGLAAVAYARIGLRQPTVQPDVTVMRRDLVYFLIVFPLVLLASLLPSGLKPVAAIVPVLLYAAYVYQTIRAEGEDEGDPAAAEGLKPLYFSPRRRSGPGWPLLIVQLIASLALLIGGAHLFVTEVTAVATYFGVPPLVLSLVLAPVATELPEKFNSIVWIRNGKDTLAMGNITGAMVFQSTIPPAFGLWLSPWILTRPAVVSGILAVLSGLVLLLSLRRHQHLKPLPLLAGGAVYGLFVLAVLVYF